MDCFAIFAVDSSNVRIRSLRASPLPDFNQVIPASSMAMPCPARACHGGGIDRGQPRIGDTFPGQQSPIRTN